MIACLATARKIPVIFAAESYKFVDKVQLDSIVYNELGSYTELIRPETAQEKAAHAPAPNSADDDGALSSDNSQVFVPQEYGGYRGGAEDCLRLCKDGGSSEGVPVPYQVINLRYDLTAIRHVSVIATESGLIPPTSVPVLIREMRLESSTVLGGIHQDCKETAPVSVGGGGDK